MISLGLAEREADGQAAGASSSPDLTERIIDSILSVASGAVRAGAAAAVEVAAGFVAKAFLRADVRVGGLGRGPFSRVMLAQIGRDLIVRGESLWLPEWRGRLVFEPAESWIVTGGVPRGSWRYQVSVSGPTATDVRWRRRDGVLHVISDAVRGQPWRGAGALQRAPVAAALAGALEAALMQEAEVPSARIIPLPAGVGDQVRNRLRADIRGRRLAMPESVRSLNDTGRAGAPSRDWEARRLGPEPSAAEVTAYELAEAYVLAALGLHPSFMTPKATAGASREARRQARVDLLEPLALAVSEAAGAAVGEPVAVSWPLETDTELVRARTVHALVQAGVELGVARQVAGI